MRAQEEAKKQLNSDVRMVKSAEKEKSLKNTITEELIDRNYLGVLNEQGMMISKMSSISAKDSNSEYRNEYHTHKHAKKYRPRSGIPRPKRILIAKEEKKIEKPGLLNFYSVKANMDMSIKVRDSIGTQPILRESSREKEDSLLVNYESSKATDGITNQ